MGLGRALFSAAMDVACELGYSEVLISTIPLASLVITTRGLLPLTIADPYVESQLRMAINVPSGAIHPADVVGVKLEIEARRNQRAQRGDDPK